MNEGYTGCLIRVTNERDNQEVGRVMGLPEDLRSELWQSSDQELAWVRREYCALFGDEFLNRRTTLSGILLSQGLMPALILHRP